ncbi:hypothetical protein KFK09_013921 [Dendrobium nobile]|uniref:Sucrose-phosphate synthase n=1 Tax=Dendrobium nobile TaxID=94219 RepID=A0A8T3B8K5_DENNO|nr:hypothetical protein KFK09_013921 [Dendrobium nobile]
MAGNEWINGYLEAILDAGAASKPKPHQSSSSSFNSFSLSSPDAVELASGEGSPAPRFSPARYFVEEVVSRFDDADLHKTWIKVVAKRNSQERSTRMENMCWRIWHLARKKKQMEWDEARRRLELVKRSRDAAEDLSSELSEGEKEKGSSSAVESPTMSKLDSESRIWSPEEGDESGKPYRLYIVLISLHGLVRGENMELGRDSDTGGQVKYVVELARALASTTGVSRVDLLTRQICSPEVDSTYAEPVEMLSCPADLDPLYSDSDPCGAYIIRLPCGPRHLYLPKESLWPHLPEFADRALGHIAEVARSLAAAGDELPLLPYVVHGHYADGAEAATRIAAALGVPAVVTGHSLGRNKLEQLLRAGRTGRSEAEAAYRISRRIEGEERGLDAAEMVVASTWQEVEEQWGMYDGFNLRIERKLRARRRRCVGCLGRYMPSMAVIPPGMDFSNVKAPEVNDGDGDLSALLGSDGSHNRRDFPQIWSEIMRFFTNPHKPMILALSRPDPKKNVTSLLKAFGESRPLRELANLTLILGNRNDIEIMSGGSGVVLTAVLKLVDRYDLYGQVAYPKHHKQSDVPEIYRLAAKTKGVFINPALVEPFGLTLIEAAAYGLPVVATKNGGPVDILKALNNGVLVDPHDTVAIADALLRLLADKSLWFECRRNGLKNIHRFSWPEHCLTYLSQIHRRLITTHHPFATPLLAAPPLPYDPATDSLRDFNDISLHFSVDGDPKPVSETSATAAVLDVLHRHHHNRTVHKEVGAAAPDFAPGRRRRLYVMAADCYDLNGRLLIDDLERVARQLMKVCGADGSAGLVFATGSTIEESVEAMRLCHVEITKFDALICSSGAEVCYPWRDLSADVEYDAHLEYRWPGDHVKSAVLRLARTDDADSDLTVDLKACSSSCYAYSLRPGAKALKIDAIKQRLRMRGFRCNLIYTRACTRLNVIPLFASRHQALRYLAIRWGVDLAKMIVLVGQKGDTDREELLPGVHTSVVLEGLVQHDSESLLRDEENYKLEDVAPLQSPNVTYLEKSCDAYEILSLSAEKI